MKPFQRSLIAAALMAALGATTAVPAVAAHHESKAMADKPMTADTSDRRWTKDSESQREALEQSLQGLKTIDAVRAKLAATGYAITAVNEAERNHVEYEVVKGQHSYEVKLDLDTATRAVKEADVAMNVWRAESTKQALKGQKVKPVTTADYSDRRYSGAWTSEKEALEKALPKGDTPANLMAKLKSMGYAVTSVNDREKDYVEVEIVKGRNSYEVQIDVDGATGKSTKIDVTTNMWQTEATEQALARAGK